MPNIQMPSRQPLMRVVQEDHFGCGIACIAMVAGTDYASVRQHLVDLPGFQGDGNFETYDCHLRQLLGTHYGIRLARKGKLEHRARMSVNKFEDYIQRKRLKSHAILAVNPRCHGARWHWIVWDDEQCRVLDPKTPPYTMISPLYYLKVSLIQNG